LQCVAVCCSVLQCVAVCCSVLKSVAVCYSVLQCVAECCTAVYARSTIRYVLKKRVWCRRVQLYLLQCVAV